MKLLLSSNSTLAGEPYLQFCKADINNFLAENKAKNIAFSISAPSWVTEGVLNKKIVEYAENKTPYLPRDTEITEEYTIDRQIGRGGYGRVYRLKDTKTGEQTGLVAKVEVCENK